MVVSFYFIYLLIRINLIENFINKKIVPIKIQHLKKPTETHTITHHQHITEHSRRPPLPPIQKRGSFRKGRATKGLIPAAEQRRPADNRKTIRSALATRGTRIKTELIRIRGGSRPG